MRGRIRARQRRSPPPATVQAAAANATRAPPAHVSPTRSHSLLPLLQLGASSRRSSFLPRVAARAGTPGVPGPFQHALGPPPLPVRDPMGDEHPHEQAELGPRGRRSREVLPEEVRTVDHDEPAEAPRILRAEAELPMLDDDLR